MLWKDSIDLKVAGEDKLIADLLKQDEEEAMEQDHELELCDIGMFTSSAYSFKCVCKSEHY